MHYLNLVSSKTYNFASEVAFGNFFAFFVSDRYFSFCVIQYFAGQVSDTFSEILISDPDQKLSP